MSQYIICRWSYIPSQNHSIGHICALKLIKTENARGLGNVCRNNGHRVEINLAALSMIHFDDMQLSMHILHEVMEVDSLS